ncbi:MAG TPA: tRNA pseudouridine(38-40) synthase TruA [Flavobacteriaceae bacterium]|nr:MAG: tRNA pseudouridine synthase A [Flavobacteriaceae bacterium]HCQ23810.1 tRNA pseudouridine(38-40) synthase TruA [Flavobacteriaceae bacterium]
MRYFVFFAYNGAGYHGWQSQPNALTVQQEMEQAFETLLQEPIALTAAGRTDAGVHASFMVAHFDTSNSLPENLCFLLNQYLSNAISINRIQNVSDSAHARFDALSRTYQYTISSVKNPFRYPYQYYIKGSLDLAQMNASAALLLEYEDFECFSKVNTDVKTFMCQIEKAHWESLENQYIFTIKANRFLRNMVRAIVGTLIEIGQGKRTLDSLHKTLRSKDRSQAGYSVPAHALFLTDIEYPKTLFKQYDSKD